MIRGETRLLTIVGHPLAYTLSPAFQNAGLRKVQANMLYVPLPVEPDRFERTYQGLLRLPEFAGGNVTNPFKLRVMPLLGRLTPEARAIGAVNTVWREGRRWVGHNTDWLGFLRAAGGPGAFRGRRVWLLGAGGAARGLAYACLKDAAAELRVLSRRPAQGAELCRDLDPKGRITLPARFRELLGTDAVLSRHRPIDRCPGAPTAFDTPWPGPVFYL